MVAVVATFSSATICSLDISCVKPAAVNFQKVVFHFQIWRENPVLGIHLISQLFQVEEALNQFFFEIRRQGEEENDAEWNA